MSVSVEMVQVHCYKTVQETLQRVYDMTGPNELKGFLVLGECFASPYSTDKFKEYAEYAPKVNQDASALGGICSFLGLLAKTKKAYIIGGSIIEKIDEYSDKANLNSKTYFFDNDRVVSKELEVSKEESKNLRYYNTSVVVSPDGFVIAKHRKAHLYDANIYTAENLPPITFQESKVLSRGDSATIFNSNFGSTNIRVGLGICYDVRFSNYADVLRRNNCEIMFFPSAFSITTGSMHWEILGRVRAVDSQCFTVMVSPARNMNSDYKAFGHSQICDPWGKVIQQLGTEEQSIIQVIDVSKCASVKSQFPYDQARNNQIYPC